MRAEIIRVDMCLLDKETGEYEFKAILNNDFIEEFRINTEILKKDLDNLVNNLYNCSELNEGDK
jgi:hypothetical protein